jgi:hypothetical protein
MATTTAMPPSGTMPGMTMPDMSSVVPLMAQSTKPACGTQGPRQVYDLPLHVAALCTSSTFWASTKALMQLSSSRIGCFMFWRRLPSGCKKVQVAQDTSQSLLFLQAFWYWCLDCNRFRPPSAHGVSVSEQSMSSRLFHGRLPGFAWCYWLGIALHVVCC